MSARRTVLGAVLAGGASSRFGSDKAAAVVAGRTLLDHALAALAGVTAETVIVGRPGGVADLPETGLGPLGGLAGALEHARQMGFASVLTIGCDMIEVPRPLLEALLATAPAYCADAPVLGHWPASLATDLVDWIATQRVFGGDLPGEGQGPVSGRSGKAPALSVRRWASAIGAVAIPAGCQLVNINTVADLESR